MASGLLDVAAPAWRNKVNDAVVLAPGDKPPSFMLFGCEVANVYVVNRTVAKAVAMREMFGGVKPATWNDVPDLLERAGLLVNTTHSACMGEPLTIDLAPLADNAIVSDIIGVPLQTPLLAAAARGLTRRMG